jgi:hypothetical protein
MSAKKQLSAFYAAQGLTGKHRRKAMQHDMRAVRRNADCYNIAGWTLGFLFMFLHTPEGGPYWYARDAFQLDLAR